MLIFAGVARRQIVIEIAIERGRFTAASVHIPRAARLRIVNRDAATYVIESAGALPGDVSVPGHSSRETELLSLPGKFVAVIEERPESEITLDLDGDPTSTTNERPVPFDEARTMGRQPLIFAAGSEPSEVAYSTFDLSVRGADAWQDVLRSLYFVQEAISAPKPPEEFALFFTESDWRRFRTSVSMVYALGKSAYSKARFGETVAKCCPTELRDIDYGPKIGLKKAGQRDILIRVSSDRRWFNQRVVRLVWRRLKGMIANHTLETGYGNPNGRSPLLGGFFDGTGNPFGEDRERAVFGKANGTYLALFKIAFDEARFRDQKLSMQQTEIGRVREKGKPLSNQATTSHVKRTGFDPDTKILRQPFVFDDSPAHTGLLFASLQKSPETLRRILVDSMANGHDALMGFMKFESATLYYVPASPRGSFPGSLRFGGH